MSPSEKSVCPKDGRSVALTTWSGWKWFFRGLGEVVDQKEIPSPCPFPLLGETCHKDSHSGSPRLVSILLGKCDCWT